MCGINGFSFADKELIRSMNKAIAYRGPDDSGIYIDSGVSLGHNRLSIIDLSKAGKQPMSNEDKSIWIVFNGEIYNYKELRNELEKKGHRFISNTDTEVIVHSYEEFGYDCVKKFNGMWAFCIYDSKKKLLFLSRDRLGIKPLYYFFNGKSFFFSSEIKGLLCSEIKRVININALNSFFSYRFVCSDETLLAGIKKLLPGNSCIYSLKSKKLRLSSYWKLNYKEDINDKSYAEAMLNKLITGSVSKRLISDVPIGLYLSGGLDSSLIAAINAKLKDEPVNSFTIGFGEKSDEFSYARKASEHIGAEHKEILLSYSKMTKEMPKIIWLMDELSSDITMFPLYFMSKEAKKKATVINTGEGADELFAGYPHYYIASKKLCYVPEALRAKAYSYYYQPFKPWQRKKLIGARAAKSNIMKQWLSKKKPCFLNRILSFDISHELPNWQLQRVDRMTMANAIEARVPFLDHNMAEFSARLSPWMKLNGFNGKWILKKVAKRYLPKSIILRKKQGFTTPMHSWAKAELENIAEAMLEEKSMKFISYSYLKKLIEKHKKIKKQRPFQRASYQLLMLVFLNIWHKEYIGQKSYNKIL